MHICNKNISVILPCLPVAVTLTVWNLFENIRTIMGQIK